MRGVECPAIATLKRVLNQVFPSVEAGTIRFPKGAADRHTSGIAMDVMLDIYEPEEKALADSIIDALIKNHAAMKWSDIVYSDLQPDGSIFYFHIPGGGHGYGGTALKKNRYTEDTEHTNHFHIDWVDFGLKTKDPKEFLLDPYQWSEDAKRNGFESALKADLAAVQGGKRAPSGPAAATPAWLWGWWKVEEDGDSYYYYFGLAGYVAWTDAVPASKGAPIAPVQNKGIFHLSGSEVDITWDFIGGGQTKEHFQTGRTQREMSGTSNRYGPLAAVKKW
jgi:hypothetical protein